jgi:CBS domain-containing protein
VLFAVEQQVSATPIHVTMCAPHEPLLAVLERFFRDRRQWVRRIYAVDSDRRPVGVVTMTKVIGALYKDAVPRVSALAAASAPVSVPGGGSVLSRILMSGGGMRKITK